MIPGLPDLRASHEPSQAPDRHQTLRGIRDDDCYYVDKTPLVRDLVSQGRYYFLSRPRRFGKSLLLDTLHELFAGSERLFRGLLIHEYWDWAKAHPGSPSQL